MLDMIGVIEAIVSIIPRAINTLRSMEIYPGVNMLGIMIFFIIVGVIIHQLLIRAGK